LAASRTERVKGRISLLTISIITIKGIRGPGVPDGTRWANIVEVDFNQAKAICPSHSGRAKDKVNTRCLGAVKM